MNSLAIRAIAVLTVSVLLGGCPSSGSAGAAGPSAATPKEVVAAAKATIEQWRQAYEIRSVDALSQLYARDLDLVVVQEGTTFLGWSSVEAMLKDRIARTGAIHIRLKDMQVITLAPDVASAFATMTRELTFEATTVTESGTLTLVLRKQGDRWLITSEHYSYKRP
ncbi:MAG: nuclear transport factor 2 family protein [Deltaproteobacteria bacterium]|nr:nuclear transport factor 2 family protein [Deltaproteobacteria bacterium]